MRELDTMAASNRGHATHNRIFRAEPTSCVWVLLVLCVLVVIEKSLVLTHQRRDRAR